MRQIGERPRRDLDPNGEEEEEAEFRFAKLMNLSGKGERAGQEPGGLYQHFKVCAQVPFLFSYSNIK